MPIMPAVTLGRRPHYQRAGRVRRWARPGAAVSATCAIAIVVVSFASAADGSRAASRSSAPAELLLRTIPNEDVLKQAILMADVRRLRLAYPNQAAFASALAGVWLPDALARAGSALWPASFGFGLDDIERLTGAGFHPREVMVAAGRFDSGLVRSRLRARGFDAAAGVMSGGADGSIDIGTPEGRLTLSALARVAVARSRLVTASTTALATSALSPNPTLAADPDLLAAGRALGSFTSAAILPSSSIRPPSGALYAPLVERHSSFLAVALDDRGVGGRTVRLALVYRQPADAKGDARILARKLRGARLIDQPATRFDEILVGLRVKAVGRVVLIGGALAASQQSGLWRALVERGDLAVLVRPGS